ncbi:hypothetical protein Ga0074812_12577 [Parafrankia irregularis]|uniref:Uncharacterized protein n=1 Tax=Parafrankia irregularis TaxID=795642 RepID=A0A0S4QUK9_9ACTN|nr:MULTISPECIES: hypothetical protein [Frankiaceae]CUU59187.1 hypothetical protein Ga0074812_12577 [Parafrankia irregularis]
MTPHVPLVPVALRPIVLTARMAALPEITPPGDIARMLALFTPPIDPASPEWTALRAALDRYDAAQNQASRDAARTQIHIAAVILLTSATSATSPHHVPTQRTPRNPGVAHDH